jgi:hypothetical protein
LLHLHSLAAASVPLFCRRSASLPSRALAPVTVNYTGPLYPIFSKKRPVLRKHAELSGEVPMSD